MWVYWGLRGRRSKRGGVSDQWEAILNKLATSNANNFWGSRMLRSRSRGQRLQVGHGFTGGKATGRVRERDTHQWEAMLITSKYSSTNRQNDMKFCRMIHWNTGNIFRPVLTFLCVTTQLPGKYTKCVCVQTPPQLLDGLTLNKSFVGWYIEGLGRFSYQSQLPMCANSTSWEEYKMCVGV